MHDQTITLYNLHNDTWYPTVLPYCHLIVDRAARQKDTGLENADAAKLHIMQKSIEAAGVSVVGPKEYDALSDPAGKITFHEGKDFFVKGEWEASAVSDDDWMYGYYDHMNKANDGVYLITSAAEYYLIPHWEIIGK